ncbi:MAG: hypothetical protein BIFFINMI_02299 [Phycisphaerae bacterium]|nr:hypothetical protein [Phycisphaerae bacterium]
MTRTQFALLLAAPMMLALPRIAAAQAPTNALCPVQTDQSVDPHIYLDYQGRRVWFCCPNCRHKFQENPQAYLANLPPLAVAPTTPQPTSQPAPPTARRPMPSPEAFWGKQAPPPTVAAPPKGAARLWQYIGRFHPIMVHFPVALLVVALLSELLGAMRGSQLFLDAARVTVVFAAFTAVLAALLGWSAAEFGHYSGAQNELLLTLHRSLGLATAGLAVIAAGLSEASHRPRLAKLRAGYRVALALAGLTVLMAGLFGGSLVFGPDHFRW